MRAMAQAGKKLAWRAHMGGIVAAPIGMGKHAHQRFMFACNIPKTVQRGLWNDLAAE